jgi:hypothetical protein
MPAVRPGDAAPRRREASSCVGRPRLWRATESPLPERSRCERSSLSLLRSRSPRSRRARRSPATARRSTPGRRTRSRSPCTATSVWHDADRHRRVRRDPGVHRLDQQRPKVDLVLHVGDIHSGKQYCTQAYDQSIFDLWPQFEDPLVYTRVTTSGPTVTRGERAATSSTRPATSSTTPTAIRSRTSRSSARSSSRTRA